MRALSSATRKGPRRGRVGQAEAERRRQEEEVKRRAQQAAPAAPLLSPLKRGANDGVSFHGPMQQASPAAPLLLYPGLPVLPLPSQVREGRGVVAGAAGRMLTAEEKTQGPARGHRRRSGAAGARGARGG